MSPTFALANQKGGVAKTTSVASLGTALADDGYRVLLVDLDPQGSLTYSLGVDPDTLDLTIHDVLLGRMPLRKVIIQTGSGDLVPSNIELAGAELLNALQVVQPVWAADFRRLIDFVIQIRRGGVGRKDSAGIEPEMLIGRGHCRSVDSL